MSIVHHSPVELTVKRIFIVFKIIRAKNQLASSNDEDKCKIYEKIADYCCELGANHQAIASYQKTVSLFVRPVHTVTLPL